MLKWNHAKFETHTIKFETDTINTDIILTWNVENGPHDLVKIKIWKNGFVLDLKFTSSRWLLNFDFLDIFSDAVLALYNCKRKILTVLNQKRTKLFLFKNLKLHVKILFKCRNVTPHDTRLKYLTIKTYNTYNYWRLPRCVGASALCVNSSTPQNAGRTFSNQWP